jgi:hypothetical protein
MSFPITSLGAVGAALSLVPGFVEKGWADGNAIAVFTAIGMCWSGYLSTHTAMLDALGYRKLTSKAILAHTVGGLVAAISAHLLFMLYTLAFGTPATFEGGADRYTTASSPVVIEFVSDNQVKVGDRIFTDEEGDTPEEEGSLAQVIKDMLIKNHEMVEVVDGQKINAAGFISADKLPAESHESLMEEVQAGFNMYCDHIAKSMYDGRTVSELTEEEKAKLDEAIPFQFTGAEETPAEAEATTEAPAAE